MSESDSHPVTGVESCSTPANPPADCCETPTYRVTNIVNHGNRGEVYYECGSCGMSYTEVHTIRRIEREDGEVLAANQATYCVCDDEWFSVNWVGKTGPSTLEFVGECGNCGTLCSDVYKYAQNEFQ